MKVSKKFLIIGSDNGPSVVDVEDNHNSDIKNPERDHQTVK
jgi:hypothetical protein